MATVDILMATYNGERFIREQIESIQMQSFTDWRLLVSDDCSSDGTLDIVRRFVEIDSRIEICSSNVRYGSAKANFLSMLHCAEAPYTMLCDQDDVWEKTKIEQFLRYSEGVCSHNEPLLLFSDMTVVDSNLRVLSRSFMLSSKLDPERTQTNHLLALNCVPGCSAMINSALVDLLNREINVSNVVMHDAWIALVASIFGNIGYIDKRTSLYRQHGSNDVGAKSYVQTIISGAWNLERKKTLWGTIHQAGELISVYGESLPTEARMLVEQYASLAEKSKAKRIISCEKYGFWKYGWARKLDQLLHL